MLALTVTGSVSRQAGGMEFSVRRLTQELAQNSDIRVEAIGVLDSATNEDAHNWTPVPMLAYPAFGPSRFGFAPGVLRHLNRCNPDIVHLHGIWMYPSIAVAKWAHKAKRPYVVSPHGMLDPWAVRHSGMKKRLAGFFYQQANLQGARVLRALCTAESRAFRTFGLKGNIAVIPNGVDIPEAPERTGAGNKPALRMLYLGRLHGKKGIEPLIQAWELASARSGSFRRWELDIVGWGEGAYPDRIAKLINERGLSGSIRLLGPKFGRDKDLVYRSADAFILPTRSEGLPMAVLEAWSYSIPVLMTRESNLTDGFEAGAAIRIGTTASEIAVALESFAEMSDGDRRGIGSRGLQHARARYQWKTIGHEMAAVYRWMLGDGTRPSCIEQLPE
jgi:glycosyltransferase involved in cell wall biosynthesis